MHTLTSTQRTIAAILGIILLFLSAGSFAQSPDDARAEEQKIKAGLIFNFLKDTTWPTEKSSGHSASITVCIYGENDPFGGHLQPIEGRTVNQNIIALKHTSNAIEARKCRLVFVGEDERDEWPALLQGLGPASVLTVGDFTGFAAHGGMIELGTNDGHIYIELNPKAVNMARLQVNESLHRLAKATHSRSGRGQ